MLPTVPPALGAVQSSTRRVSRRVPEPLLPAARASTARAIAARAHRPAAPPSSGIGPGSLPRKARRHLPAWASRRTYVDLVQALAVTPELQAACRQHEIAVTTWVAAMTAAAAHAESSTGELRADQVTVAADCSRSAKIVQRALAIAARFGIAMELYRGRELGRDERLALVQEFGNHPQRGIPSVWQLAYIPPRIAVHFTRLTRRLAGRWVIYLDDPRDESQGFVHLPPLGQFFSITHLQFINLQRQSTTASARRTGAAAPRPAPRKRVDPQRQAQATRLAAGMVSKLPWLAGEPLSRLTPALMRFATGTTPWTASDVLLALRDQAQRRGQHLGDLSGCQIRTRPAVVLAGLLRELDVEADHPGIGFYSPAPTDPVVLPEHECDHGWVTTTTTDGHTVAERCAGGIACAQLHANVDTTDISAEPATPPAWFSTALGHHLPARRTSGPSPLTLDQARERLRALPDWGRRLIATAPDGLDPDEAVIWAAQTYLRTR